MDIQYIYRTYDPDKDVVTEHFTHNKEVALSNEGNPLVCIPLNEFSNQWVSVKERLPEVGEKVVVLSKSGEIDTDYIEIWEGEPCFAENYGEIVLWTPIPIQPENQNEVG